MAYGDAHAAWYDALYDALGKAPEAEAADLLAVATAELGRPPTSWLDVACGTGRHLATVADTVDDVVGVDLSPQMLDVARTRLSGRVALHVADQRELDLGRTFDVVTSLFSSIGYARDLDELDRTVAALAAHVAPGGLLLLEPWVDPSDWQDGLTQVVDVEDGGRRAVRMLTSRREGDVSVLDAAIVSAAAGRLTVDREEHRMLLVPHARLLASVRATGLQAEDHPGPGPAGRGLVLARRAVAS